MRKTDMLTSGLMFCGAALVYFWLIPGQIHYRPAPGLSPAFWPKFLMITLMLLSGISFLRALLGTEGTKPSFDLSKLTMVRVFALPLLVIMYIYFLELFGYLIATITGLAIFFIYFGVRELKIIIPVSACVPLLLYMFFEKILKIVMPKGALFY